MRAGALNVERTPAKLLASVRDYLTWRQRRWWEIGGRWHPETVAYSQALSEPMKTPRELDNRQIGPVSPGGILEVLGHPGPRSGNDDDHYLCEHCAGEIDQTDPESYEECCGVYWHANGTCFDAHLADTDEHDE